MDPPISSRRRRLHPCAVGFDLVASRPGRIRKQQSTGPAVVLSVGLVPKDTGAAARPEGDPEVVRRLVRTPGDGAGGGGTRTTPRGLWIICLYIA